MHYDMLQHKMSQVASMTFTLGLNLNSVKSMEKLLLQWILNQILMFLSKGISMVLITVVPLIV